MARRGNDPQAVASNALSAAGLGILPESVGRKQASPREEEEESQKVDREAKEKERGSSSSMDRQAAKDKEASLPCAAGVAEVHIRRDCAQDPEQFEQ